MAGTNKNVEAVFFDMAKDAMEQTTKEIDANGVAPIDKKINPTLKPEGEPTEEQLESMLLGL